MKENKILYNISRGIYKFLLRILYNPKVKGKENIPIEGSCLLVGNHVHAYDGILVMAQTKRFVHYFAKIEIFKGIHGKFFEAIGLIKVDRKKGSPASTLEAIKCLNNGGVIGIFPEGTRNKTKEDLLRFKKGAVSMAIKTNSPIVPFAIQGTYKIFRKRPKIIFGEPIDVSNMEANEANEFVREKILNLLKNSKI